MVAIRMHQKSDGDRFFVTIGRQIGAGQHQGLSDSEAGQVFIGSLAWR